MSCVSYPLYFAWVCTLKGCATEKLPHRGSWCCVKIISKSVLPLYFIVLTYEAGKGNIFLGAAPSCCPSILLWANPFCCGIHIYDWWSSCTTVCQSAFFHICTHYFGQPCKSYGKHDIFPEVFLQSLGKNVSKHPFCYIEPAAVDTDFLEFQLRRVSHCICAHTSVTCRHNSLGTFYEKQISTNSPSLPDVTL